MTAPRVLHGSPPHPGASAEVVVIGAGACGLTAALMAQSRGREVLVVERDARPSGSTSMSSGYVPAPATRAQRALGIDDSPDLFLKDIMSKSAGTSHPRLAALAAYQIGPAIDWLAENAGIDWIVLDDFLYPGHSRHRMHAVAERTGAALHARLLAAVAAADIPLLTGAQATTLWTENDGRISAVGLSRLDGQEEVLGCDALILACNGYGGNPDLVAKHIPEMATAIYHGHAGNTGDALLWGRALGAKTEHLSGYQGHGSLASPHNIPITWVLMTEGGLQVNALGKRFASELGGYSEAAPLVLDQPGGVAWNIYDGRLHAMALNGFADYRIAVDAGAIRQSDTINGLAEALGLPVAALVETVAEFGDPARPDPFGRDTSVNGPLESPYFGVKVTGALFHTQGGLVIDDHARVLLTNGDAIPNLYAAGGAACGESGPKVFGYLSGNGLLSAIGYGFLAGTNA